MSASSSSSSIILFPLVESAAVEAAPLTAAAVWSSIIAAAAFVGVVANVPSSSAAVCASVAAGPFSLSDLARRCSLFIPVLISTSFIGIGRDEVCPTASVFVFSLRIDDDFLEQGRVSKGGIRERAALQVVSEA